MKTILGISAFYHDSAAALIKDGEIISACQEERFTRIKHDPSFPSNAIKNIVSEEKISLDQINNVVFYDKPLLKFERLLETYVSYAPKGLRSFNMAMPIWLKEKLFQKEMLLKELNKIDKNFNDRNKLLFAEHHYSHAASAFYPSPFQKAIILTLDGVGEWATSTIAIGEGNKIKILKEIHFPHSLGLLYSAFTYYTGFKVNSGEYKLMGLAPYGRPIYEKLILENLIDLKNDGSYRLNMKYFNYPVGLTMTNKKFENLFGENTRKSEEEKLTQFHMDIAASIQLVIEKIILKITKNIFDEYKIKNLCLAGGVALNCVANGKILKQGLFEKIWIQPAAGDAGGALGASLLAWHNELNNKRIVYSQDMMRGSFLGPKFSDEETKLELEKCSAVFKKFDDNEIYKLTAEKLSEGFVIGWFQGRMEFGPRALGSRSIIGDPRSSKMQKNMNLKIKYRESFRPFAPSILIEDLNDWFELDHESKYMLLVAKIKQKHRINISEKDQELFGIDKLNLKRSSVPAITHVDYSARIQTVSADTNPRYYKLLCEFKEKTNCPILLNTSFNVRGEPLVCTPSDAFRCFMATEMDMLVCENYVMYKKEQNSTSAEDYKTKYLKD